MSPAGNLDKYWIDNNFSYLKNRLGLLPLFEPSGHFFDDLGQLGEGGNLAGVAVRAAENIFSHAGLPTIPVTFASGMTNAGEFQFSEQPGLPGGIIPSGIRISDKYATISDPQARGMAVGTILAHEIAHYCLMKNDILRQTVDNERLTDLALMVLGLGKLWFNGRNLVVEERKEHLGYLSPLDMTYAFMEYARHNGLSLQALGTNLSPDAQRLLLSWLNQVNTGIKETRHEEELIADEELRFSVVAMQEQLEQDVQNTVESIQTQKKSLATAAGDQDIINKTISFWEIDTDDHRMMGEFVTALSSGLYEADFMCISQSLDALKREVMQISSELKPVVGKDWNIPRRKITDLADALANLQGRIMTVRLRISEVQYLHKKCYIQLDLVQKDLETTQITVKSCKNMMKEIQFLHEFFQDNQRAWPKYKEDSVLVHTISGLLSSEEEEENLTNTGQEAARVMCFLSSPKEKYEELFGRPASLKEIASRARSEKEGVVAMLHTLQSLHASQIALIDKYLKQASLLEFRLDDTLATAKRIRKEIPELKSRQDDLKAWSRRISIAREDIAEIRGITQAVRSPGLEGEIAHSIQILGEIRNAVREDVERVKSRSESNRISPVETHWKGYEAEEENIQQVTARFLRWKETQQIYLNRVEQIKKRSPIHIFRNSLTRLKESIEKK